MALVQEFATSLPGGMQNAFWTIQMLVNGYAGLKFMQWKAKN